MTDTDYDSISLPPFVGGKIGEGRFGQVFLYANGNDDKCIKVFNDERDCTLEHTLLRLIKRISHVHMIMVYDKIAVNDKMGLVMSYNPGYNITEYRNEYPDRILEINFLDRLCTQMLSALSALSAVKMAHRDIREENIVFNPENGMFTLVDFGSACNKKCISYRADHWWILSPNIICACSEQRAPTIEEYIMGDLYALGVMLFILSTSGVHPFHIVPEEEQDFDNYYDFSKVNPMSYYTDEISETDHDYDELNWLLIMMIRNYRPVNDLLRYWAPYLF
jgi:serine/threonine protein kinase